MLEKINLYVLCFASFVSVVSASFLVNYRSIPQIPLKSLVKYNVLWCQNDVSECILSSEGNRPFSYSPHEKERGRFVVGKVVVYAPPLKLTENKYK